jgi:hypothetical protein
MNRFDPLETIKEILWFLAVTAIAFGWMFLMMLIISFVAASVVKITIPVMLVTAVCFTVAVDIVAVIRRITKKRKEREIQRMLRE